jgi:hypothetical protein
MIEERFLLKKQYIQVAAVENQSAPVSVLFFPALTERIFLCGLADAEHTKNFYLPRNGAVVKRLFLVLGRKERRRAAVRNCFNDV